jgi:hypothetical protein
MRIICKLETRALDAVYLQVGEEGPRCGLFASWRRGPWMRIICKWEERALDTSYLQMKEESPRHEFARRKRGELFAKCRKGHGCGVTREKGGLGIRFFTVGRGPRKWISY